MTKLFLNPIHKEVLPKRDVTHSHNERERYVSTFYRLRCACADEVIIDAANPPSWKRDGESGCAAADRSRDGVRVQLVDDPEASVARPTLEARPMHGVQQAG